MLCPLSGADGFLDRIFAAPDDDLPRLVYADWLEENNQAIYAEYIRLDCKLEHRESMLPERRKKLRLRRHELRLRLQEEWAHFGTIWSQGLPSERGIFRRGGTISADEFLRCSSNWWPLLPITAIAIINLNGFEGELAQCSYLSRLEHLGVGIGWQEYPPTSNDIVSNEMVVHLAKAPCSKKLSTLEMGPLIVNRESLLALARSPFLENLKEDTIQLWVLQNETDTEPILVRGSPGETARETIEAFLESLL